MAIKPLKLSLTTFLKICTKKPQGKIGEVKRFTRGGGYDFYKRMKLIAAQMARNEITLDQARKASAKINRPSERVHTLAAIENLHSLLELWKLEWSEPQEGAFSSASGLLKIKLRPDLAFKQPDGKIKCLYIWNLARPELTKPLAAEGLWLAADEIGKPERLFGLLDLRKKIIVGEELITPASGPQLKLDLMTVEEIWKDIHNPALSYEQTLSHISGLTLLSAGV